MFRWPRFWQRSRGRKPADLVAAAARDANGGSSGGRAADVSPESRAESQRRLIAYVGEIPGYSIRRLIHHGVQGIVFEGVQTGTGRRVAIKTTNPSRGDLEADERARARFAREIQALAELNDPGIVTIYDSGSTATQRYFVMEFVDGVDLATHLAAHDGDRGELLRVMLSIAESLKAAHQRGIVHRDLKPSNILIEAGGRIRILDFGLAKFDSPENASADVRLTETGQFYGTRRWASPEQVRGAVADISPQTDVYTLGVLLFHGLTGAFPYPVGDSSASLSRHILQSPAESMRLIRRDVPRDLESIVQKCLRKESAQRYADAGALADDLRRHLEGRRVSARGGGLAYRTKLRFRRAWMDGTVLAVSLAPVLAFAPAFALQWTSLFESFRLTSFELIARQRAFWHPDVVVIAMTDETHAQMDELAAKHNVAGVSADQLLSLRAMHGKLMERLAAADPRAVVWHIAFEADAPEYDAAFVAGMKAIQGRGKRVVVSARQVKLPYLPVLAAQVFEHADDWGWSAARSIRADGAIAGMELIYDRPQSPQYLGLPLAAYRAWLQNPDEQLFRWIQLESSVRRDTRADGKLTTVELIPACSFGTLPIAPDDASAAVAPVWSACTYAALPARAACQKATFDYHRVLQMRDDDLRSAICDKLVLIGDCRVSTTTLADRHRMLSPDGERDEFGVFLLGRVLSELLARRCWVEIEMIGLMVMVFAGALLGALALVVTLATRRIFQRVLLVSATLAAIPILGLWILEAYNRIIPLPGMAIAWLTAFALGALIIRLRKPSEIIAAD